MDESILIKTLTEYTENDLYIKQVYNRLGNINDSAGYEFNQYIKDLTSLSEKQYDFQWLTDEAGKLDITRRDFRNLCDKVCELIGYYIDELVSSNIVITNGSGFEEYCPFTKHDLVWYTKHPLDIDTEIIYDGKTYTTVNCKKEKTPYYDIYVSLLA